LISANLLKIIFIIFSFSVFYFALAYLIEILLTSLAFLWIYLNLKKGFKWKINFFLMKSMLKDGWPLVLSGVAIAVYMKIDQVMIGTMLTNADLGNYSVAVRLSEAWYFIPAVIIISVFPAMIKTRKANYENYLNKLQGLYSFMVWMGIIVAIPVSLFSNQIIHLLYGNQYTTASGVLAIYIWAGIFVFLGNASAKYLVVENFTKIAFLKSLVGAVINVALNLILIPKYGINGAAFATLFSYAATVFVLIIPGKTRVNGKLFFNAFSPFYVYNYFKSVLK
jgi:O-antigen/teichoic acid export membrane protein